MLAGDTESDAPPPGFEHVKEGTHSLDNVINRLSDAEVRAGLISSCLPEVDLEKLACAVVCLGLIIALCGMDR